MTPAKLTYTNHRGETAQRIITPLCMWYGATKWHPEPQVLIQAYDHEKEAFRDFALKDFGYPAPADAGGPVPYPRLYSADEPMADGEIQMTAAESVLGWLLIEKIGVPDDRNYSPNEARDILVRRLDHANEMENERIRSAGKPAVHQFTGDGPTAKGVDNCQICGRWIGEIETDICRDRLAPAPAAEPTIKALEWKKSALLTMWQKQLIVRVTDTVLGRFSVCQAAATVDGPLPPAWIGPDGVHHEVADVEAGVAAVEDHYERVIRSTITHPAPMPVSAPEGMECHGLDTPERVCFYEQDFYVLSNFSAFTIMWKGLRFDTSEAVYHWEKFNNPGPTPFELAVLDSIRCAPSAHVAFKIGQKHRRLRRPDWDDVKVEIMREILRAKASQHEYVRRKLLATGDRELVENSWRDDFWGWGPNRDGKNMLGKLWMEIRAERRAAEG